MKDEFKKIRRNLYRSANDPSKFRFYISVDGVRHSKTYFAAPGTKTEMKEAAAVALNEFRQKKRVTNNWFNNLSEGQKNITFDDYFKKWVKIKKRIWKNGNSDLVEGAYMNHIKPVLGDLKVNEITPMHISELMDNLHSSRSKAPLRKSAKRAILAIIKSIYKKLINDEVVLKSPVKSIHEVRRSYREEKTLVSSPVQTFELVRAAIYDLYEDNPKLLSAFLFGLLCGKRLQEVLSLKWTDINLGEGSFVVRAENSKIHTALSFGIPDELIHALNRIKKGNDKFVFPSNKSKTGHWNSLQYHYKKIRVKSGVPDYTFHYQRNVYVSALSQMGVSDDQLAVNLGHVDTSQMKTYVTKNRLSVSREVISVLETLPKTDTTVTH